jgi:hypothetical protein
VRRYLWMSIAVVSLLLLGGAIQLRLDAQAGETERLFGLTGQRQAIEFRVDEDGRPLSFETELYNHCPADEWRVRWSPSDGAPVPFRISADRLSVREEGQTVYDRGRTGSGAITMRARLTADGVEGHIRSVWRFARDGEEYAVCETGYVPFAVGERARERLEQMPRAGEPWSLYPDEAEVTAPRSVDRFAEYVDAVCGSTYRRLQEALSRRRRSLRRHPDKARLLGRQYFRLHVAQLRAILRLGPPPAALETYEPWLRNFSGRLYVERDQTLAWERGDHDAAARLAARYAVMKARGNALGLRLGLDTCTSNGPTGAPNVR